ncbi:MAG: helix-turn-helix domain-containing protein [Fusicatenibacter sp.]|nr:helix-turn-helix domain-containing protein [Fusicatenibacter sp.]
MKLSAAFVADRLQRIFNIEKLEGFCGDLLTDRPAICTKETVFEEGRIYVADSAVLGDPFTKLPDHAFFLICQNGTASFHGNGCLISKEVPMIDVFSKVQELFWIFDEWHANLLQARLDGRSIQSLLDLSLPVLGQPLMVVGMDFTIISSASNDPDFFHETVFGSSEDTHESVIALRNSELYHQVRELDGAFYFPSDVTGVASLCVNIKRHGQTSYRLLMLETGQKIDTTEGFLLEFLADMIKHAFTHNVVQKSSPAQSLHTVLLRTLDDRTADYVAISQKLDALGWYSRHEYCCFFLQLSDLDQKNLTSNSICAYLENILPGCSAFSHNGNIVVFVNLTLAEFTLETLMERIVHFVEESSLNAGFSRSMSGHMNLRRQYIQAKIALQMGTRKYPDKRMHPFNDISFDYILEQATKRLPGYMISHESLLRLKEHDASTGSEYIPTLRRYLDNHCNVVQTARDLFIHRSTLLYRLEKIRELLHSDLSDPDEILYLMLSFRFIDMEEAKHLPGQSILQP